MALYSLIFPLLPSSVSFRCLFTQIEANLSVVLPPRKASRQPSQHLVQMITTKQYILDILPDWHQGICL